MSLGLLIGMGCIILGFTDNRQKSGLPKSSGLNNVNINGA